MQKLQTILSRKQPHFQNVSTSSFVSDALYQMSCQNLDYLVVVDDNENFAGVLTEHDITMKVMFYNEPLNKTVVKDVMNNQLPHATGSDTVEGCMQLMQQHHIRFVPVFEEFHFIGVVSSEDILAEVVYNRLEIFDV
jgi:signal-transduction protein with cAMP-binding, CBS, and nucleotidyltransferase domain